VSYLDNGIVLWRGKGTKGLSLMRVKIGGPWRALSKCQKSEWYGGGSERKARAGGVRQHHMIDLLRGFFNVSTKYRFVAHCYCLAI